MPDATRPRALLHGISVGGLLSILFPAIERGLSPLVIPLAEPATALLVVAVLALPALPLPRRGGRILAAVAAAAAALTAAFHPTPMTDTLALAAGTLWLGLAPRYFSRRGMVAGAAAGFAAMPLVLLVRPGGAATLVLGVAAAALALGALAWAEPAPATPERRARSFRLRGLLALGALLHLDAVLRQQLAAEPLISALMAAAGLAAALLLAFAPGPLPATRRELLFLAALVVAAVAASLAGVDAAASSIAARTLLVVLVGRALVPAGGRRPRIQVSVAWLTWAAAAAVAGYVSGALALALAAATALLALALLPRAGGWRELDAS